MGTREIAMQAKKYKKPTSEYDSVNLNPLRGINCPKCYTFWFHEYVPEYCAECGAKLTDNPGQADGEINDIVELIKLAKAPIPISKCTKCQLEYPGTPDQWKNGCLRCYGPLTQYGDYSFRYKVKKFVRRILSRP
jgi:hypothetical protein